MSTASSSPGSRRLAATIGVALVLVAGTVITLGTAFSNPSVPMTSSAPSTSDQPPTSTTQPKLAKAPQYVPAGPARPALPPMEAPPVPPLPPTSTGTSADLPDGAPIPLQGKGNWRVVPGTSERVGEGKPYTYTIEVEDGVELPEGDTEFGRAVQATLEDKRSWVGDGSVSVQRIDSGTPDFRIRLSAQETARERCGFEIPVDVSCHAGGNVHLSAVRWIRGAVAFGGDLVAYRQYMVNHEVGHAFGHKHRVCGADGGPAPVMMQQTFSTANNEIADITRGTPQGVSVPRDGKRCAANAWPHPS